jgi:hypothetical protein
VSAVRLYVDEDASEQAVVRGLRERGIDVVTTADAGRLGSTDFEQLAHAVEHGRAVYTFNVGDFARLHVQYQERGLSHVGIVVVPDPRCSVGEKIRRVARLVRSSSAEDMVNRMAYL